MKTTINAMLFVAAIALFSNISYCFGNNEKDSLAATEKPVRVYNTTRLTTEKPVIDGILNDSCWKTGIWASDFTQWVPVEGAKPSQETQLKIFYDEKNIYVAIRAFDSEPEKISRKAARRDELTGDAVGINFDSYHDHRTGFEFNVTASGQKIDLLLTNPWNGDFSWNAVWTAKVGFEDSAWVAEYEIPLSQLRYSNEPEQVWGMHCWRWIDRLQEESDWELQSSTGPGMLYQFGELHGINGLPKSRRIELMPYALGKLKTYEREPDNPFANSGKTWLGNAGADLKIGLTSNFTADLTVNPDFGQVESDPSVMNLTAFETFYDEKRPFFLEGKNIFSFDFDDVNLFYSRRIGHTPTYEHDLDSNEFMQYPDNTSILSAVKLSGKTSKGLSIGILQSITANEFAKIDSADRKNNLLVEPLTNYAIIRLQQDFKQGNTVLGGILTSVNRSIHDAQLYSMNREAYTGGLDVLHHWNDKEFYVDAKFVGSYIKSRTDAIAELQQSSARYFQRPDIEYVHFDSTRTNLSGLGGRIKIGKGSKGLWRYSEEINWRSPGLDLNDIGFMQTTDVISQTSSLSYFINKPVSIFRTYSIGINQTNKWDFGMNHLSSGAEATLYMEFLNKWAINTNLEFTSQALDTRILRGGYAMLIPSIWSHYLYVHTDNSRKIFADLTTDINISEDQSSKYYSAQPKLTVMPMNTLKLSVSIFYSKNFDNLQYVDTKSFNNEDRYILGRIDQQTMAATFRIDYNITPEFSIQYYGSPFASIGKFSDFKIVDDPRNSSYDNRFSSINTTLHDDYYEVDENNVGNIDYTFDNPDFNFCQFRSNLVLRWEYRPGSQIYLIWSQDKTNDDVYKNDAVYEAMKGLNSIYPNNIFLIKINYWFSI